MPAEPAPETVPGTDRSPGNGLAGGILTIDHSALAANWRRLDERTGRAECSAVVKGDAYGTGLAEAVSTLSAAGCKTFFVALPAEGIAARAVAPDATIYVLNGLFPGTADAYAAAKLRPVLGSLGEVEEWTACCSAGGKALPAALHVDTGMNRLGFRLAEAAELAARKDLVAAFTPSLLISHLSSADTPESDANIHQLNRFLHARALFPTVPASLANSSGIFLGANYHFDLARPGVALYGGNPVPAKPNPMHTVVTLQARVCQTRSVPADEPVGYGGAQTTSRPSRVAVVSVGYADGFHRAAGSSDTKSGARGVIAGHDAPLIGRISMDLIALDITDIPEGLVERGTLVELLGPTVSVDEAAGHAGTIGYEFLTGLGRRYDRIHKQA